MKRMLIASTCLVLCLTGCAAFNKEVAPRVAKAVQVYCLETPETRALIRSQVNAMVAPASVRVTCAGDQ